MERIVRRILNLKIEKIISSFRIEKTKHGFHIHVKLWKAITFERSIELRLFIGDDPLRMVKDIVKIWAGAKEFDLLFTKKWKGWLK